jgi:hypothetical protein
VFFLTVAVLMGCKFSQNDFLPLFVVVIFVVNGNYFGIGP